MGVRTAKRGLRTLKGQTLPESALGLGLWVDGTSLGGGGKAWPSLPPGLRRG